MSLVDELSAKESELSRVHDENDDLVDEVERLRAENVRLASQASRVPRKPRSYDMGIQCEGRMCEKASQTRNLDYAPRSRLPRPDNTRRMQRTNSVGNLSDRTSSPVRSYGSRLVIEVAPICERFLAATCEYQYRRLTATTNHLQGIEPLLHIINPPLMDSIVPKATGTSIRGEQAHKGMDVRRETFTSKALHGASL